MERILLTTGGTGGHIFPALAVAEEIVRRNPKAMILFMGSLYGPEADIVAKAGFDFVGLPVRGVIGRGMRGAIAAVGMVRGIVQAMRVIRKVRPQYVLGFGGYASFAGVLAARLCHVPAALHEQNAVPGKSNRILSKLVDTVFLSLPDAGGAFPPAKVELVGNPVRAAIKELYAQANTENAQAVGACACSGLDVVGAEADADADRRRAASRDRRAPRTGDRRSEEAPDRRQSDTSYPLEKDRRAAGATPRRHPYTADRRNIAVSDRRLEAARRVLLGHSLNVVRHNTEVATPPHAQALPNETRQRVKNLRLLVMGGSLGARAINDGIVAALPQLARVGVEIWHQTGLAEYERIRAQYRENGAERVRVEAFIDDMRAAYVWADLAVSRAGGSSLAELTVAGVPALLVPFPFATHDHQLHNARSLEKAGGAVVLEQKDIVPPTGSNQALVDAILALATDEARLRLMGERCRAVARPEAAAAIVDSVERACTACRQS